MERDELHELMMILKEEVEAKWGFFRRRSGFFREGDHQFCDSDQESERSDAGKVIVAEVIGIVKQAA
jgi:hypothetical protein